MTKAKQPKSTKEEQEMVNQLIENAKEFYLDICSAAEPRSNRRALNKFEAYIGARIFIETLFMMDGISDAERKGLEGIVSESVTVYKKKRGIK